MTSDGEYANRQLIPRWNLSATSRRIGDTLNLRPKSALPPSDRELLSVKESVWRNERGTSAAVDLLGAALALGVTDTPVVSQTIESLAVADLSHSQRALLRAFDRSEAEDGAAERETPGLLIRGLRKRLVEHPRDAISWVDLAYLYELSGDSSRAAKCIMTAVSLSPNSRIVLRSSARFFSHKEDPLTALRVLRSADSLKFDPWLISAEISVSEAFDLRTRNVKRAIQVVTEMDTHPLNKAELLGTLATLEFRHSTSLKKGRRWLREALVQPNENTIAQAEHLVNRHKIGKDKDVGDKHAPFDYEARTMRALWSQSFSDTIGNAKEWARYQPLSSRPLLIGSFVLSVLIENFPAAIDFLREASTRCTYSDPMVINNLAFCFASKGQPDQASKELRRIEHNKLDDAERACVTATRGLIAFRERKSSIGRQEYEKAITFFRSEGDFEKLALALTFYGRELLRVRSTHCVGVFKEVDGLIRRYGTWDAGIPAERALRKILELTGGGCHSPRSAKVAAGSKDPLSMVRKEPEVHRLITEVEKSGHLSE